MADTIDTQIENMRNFALSYAANANDALFQLLNVNTSFSPTLGPPGEVDVVPVDITLQPIPDPSPVAFQRTDAPTAGALLEVVMPPLPGFPVDKTGDQPDLMLPDQPAPLAPYAGKIPTIADVGDIEDLDASSLISGIVAPVPHDITLGTAPTIALPDTQISRPGLAPPAPTDLPQQFQGAYAYAASIMPATVTAQSDALFARWFPQQSARTATLEMRLAAWMRGEFEFDDEIADAATVLARDQIDAEYTRSTQDAVEGPGKRGYRFPDAVYRAATTSLIDKRGDAVGRSAMDLRKVRFDYQQKMLELAVREAKDLTISALTIYVNVFQQYAVINGQCLDYGRAVLQALVDLYQAQVEGYKASLEGIQAEVAVAEIRLKIALSALDAYKVELEAERLKVEVDQQRVQLYEARLRAVGVIVEVWKTRADVLRTRADIERLKLEAAKIGIEAYAALASAKEAEYRAQAAALAGQTAIQQAYTERVRARQVELEGFKTQVDAINARLNGLLAYNESVTRQYAVAVQAWEGTNAVERTVVETDLAQYRSKAEAVSRTNEQTARIADFKLKQWQVGKELVLKRADQSIERAKAEMMGHIENLKLQIQVAVQMGANLQGIATAALNGINAVISKSQQVTA